MARKKKLKGKIKKKTNRAAAKRFSLTGTGLVKRAKGHKRHGTGPMSRKRKRHLRDNTLVVAAEQKRIKNLITA